MSDQAAPLTAPALRAPRKITADWTMLRSWAPLPGLGALAVNTLLLKGREPVLVDTGLAVLGDGFMAELEREIDPAEIAWIWISHADADHIGNLQRVLDRAPKAKVVTAYLGVAKLALLGFDLGRVQMLQPGDVFEAGGRRLHPVRPPYYDAPETTGFYDPAADLLYVADCFGALLPAPVEQVEDAPKEALHQGMMTWSALDAPWLAQVDRTAFGRGLAAIEQIAPRHLVSAHLPFLEGRVETVTDPIFDAYSTRALRKADPMAPETVLGGFARGADLAA